MKRIIAVAVFESYVPDDMSISDITEQIEKRINDKCDMFRINIRNYHNEDEAEPIFELTDTHCGESMTLAIG